MTEYIGESDSSIRMEAFLGSNFKQSTNRIKTTTVTYGITWYNNGNKNLLLIPDVLLNKLQVHKMCRGLVLK